MKQKLKKEMSETHTAQRRQEKRRVWKTQRCVRYVCMCVFVSFSLLDSHTEEKERNNGREVAVGPCCFELFFVFVFPRLPQPRRRDSVKKKESSKMCFWVFGVCLCA
jgi:hypothetical protein